MMSLTVYLSELTDAYRLTGSSGYHPQMLLKMMVYGYVSNTCSSRMFDKEQRSKHGNDKPFTADKLFYNKEKNCFICHMGQAMDYIGEVTRKTGTGFMQKLKRYQAKSSFNCPLNGAYHKSKTNRTIEINERLQKQKATAHQLLNGEDGIKHRKKRCWDVEPVFGNIKQNHGFKRFMLRGKEKVAVEWRLLAIAQNIRKKQP